MMTFRDLSHSNVLSFQQCPLHPNISVSCYLSPFYLRISLAEYLGISFISYHQLSSLPCHVAPCTPDQPVDGWPG